MESGPAAAVSFGMAELEKQPLQAASTFSSSSAESGRGRVASYQRRMRGMALTKEAEISPSVTKKRRVGSKRGDDVSLAARSALDLSLNKLADPGSRRRGQVRSSLSKEVL
jgi:hypothetical protein